MEGKKHQVDDDPQKILMIPMIAHGHVTPFFELAKKLSKANFHIYLCSTSAVLSFLKQSQEKYFSNVSNTNIELIELHLPSMPDLPSHCQSSKGLPSLYPPLFTAYKMAGESFSNIVNNLNPDLIIEDFFQAWAPDIALSKNIPIVSFSVVSAASYSFTYHIYLSDGVTDDYPFPEICLSNNEIEIGLISLPTGSSITLFMEKILDFSARKKSCDIVLINNWKETEVKYMQYLSSIINKKILSVGPLIGQTDESTQDDDQDSDIIEWLDKKDRFSTVYAVFGSESVWSKENIQEIAHGIELSNVNFLWVLRFPGHEVEQVLPEGFLNRVNERGMVVSRWVPHAKIMRHKSIGGFLNHCGWNSTVECIHFGVPLIAMPSNIDQFITANYAVELGMALKVQRDEKGGLKREEIAKAIRNVIMEKKMGEELREKSKELSEKIRIKEEKEIDQEVVEELRNLCLMNKKEKSI